MSRVRQSVVAGKFYPASVSALTEWIKSQVRGSVSQLVVAAIAPHAGYVFSGDLAVKTLSGIGPKDVFVLLGPNHTGLGNTVALSGSDTWQTPFGDIKVDVDLREEMLSINGITIDDIAHLYEHSLEVFLPMLKFLYPSARILPVTIKGDREKDFFITLGKSLFPLYNKYKKKVAWIVSSDMNHYENQKVTLFKDKLAIDKILNLDYQGLWEEVEKHKISMCGIHPAMVLLSMLEEDGDNIEVDLVGHKTSGDVLGDYEQVVGYMGCLFLHKGAKEGL